MASTVVLLEYLRSNGLKVVPVSMGAYQGIYRLRKAPAEEKPAYSVRLRRTK